MKLCYPLLICVLLMSCRKDVMTEDNSDEVRNMLIGSWKLVSLHSAEAYDWDGNGSIETNIFSIFSACEQDNKMHFYDGSNAAVQATCTHTSHFTWKLEYAGTYIHFTNKSNGGSSGKRIKNLSSANLTANWNIETPTGTITKVEAYYQKL